MILQLEHRQALLDAEGDKTEPRETPYRADVEIEDAARRDGFLPSPCDPVSYPDNYSKV